MNDHSQRQYQSPGVFDNGQDNRDRRDEYPQSHQQHSHQPQYAQTAPNSPPQTASPFAFAPPPLSTSSSASRPPMPFHHSDPTPQSQIPQQQEQYYGQRPPAAPAHSNNSYSYPGGAPMSYRSFSGGSPRQAPLQSPMARNQPYPISTSNGHNNNNNLPPPLPSPTGNSSYPPYQRQDNMYSQGTNSSPHQAHQQSPQRPTMYPTPYYGAQYGQPPQASDMPRSLSYPSSYSAQYNGYLPALSPAMPGVPPNAHPHLNRHNTTALGDGVSGMEQGRPYLGYSFANRLPLVDRPFKCDECVQSFNRNHDLKRHKRIHLSVKPFGCDKCGKTFSRKDALRRHWLVKGCRGEDGATAPITPMYPINGTPALSPPTPPNRTAPAETNNQNFPPQPLSFSHPSAPPPLDTHSSRTSEQSQLLITPNEAAESHSIHRGSMAGPPMDEPLLIDPAIDPALNGMGSNTGRESRSGSEGGYFEGVVGMKSDGTAMIDHKSQDGSSYSRYTSSPHDSVRHHPYSRPTNGVPSPARASPNGPDGRPVFALPFTPSNPSFQREGLLAPPMDNGIPMEKQGSQQSDNGEPVNWQRWHRPSFPFPPTTSMQYNYDGATAVDMGQQQAFAAS